MFNILLTCSKYPKSSEKRKLPLIRVNELVFQIRCLTWPNDDLADKFDVFCIGVFRSVLDDFGLHPGAADEPSNDAQCRGILFSHLVRISKKLFYDKNK